MRYCSQCGHTVDFFVPAGDHLPRFVCGQCGTIHYQNPRMIVGCIAEWQDQVLLCRRAIEPRFGYWTLPAGFMENGETTMQGALRETREETAAIAEAIGLYTVINVVHTNQVHLFYRARLTTPTYHATAESSEVGLFREADIPWSDLAFPTVEFTLKRYFADRHRLGADANFGVHTFDINVPLKSKPNLNPI